MPRNPHGHGMPSQTQQGAQRGGLGVRGKAPLVEAGAALAPELLEVGEDAGRVFFSTGPGGDCPEDMQLLGNDPCLERGLGFPLPKVSAVRTFLERFHDEAWEQSRPPRAVQKSFISACHENGLLAWLRHPDRAQEPGGRIGFAVSAQRSVELTAALTQVPDAQWRTYNREADGTFMYTMKSRTKPAAGTCPANISPSTPPGSSSRC